MKDILRKYEIVAIWILVWGTLAYFFVDLYINVPHDEEVMVKVGSLSFDDGDYITFAFVFGMLLIELSHRFLLRRRIDMWDYESLKEYTVFDIIIGTSVVVVIIIALSILYNNTGMNAKWNILAWFILSSTVSGLLRNRYFISDDYVVINNKQVKINEETTLVDTDNKDITLRTDGEIYVVEVGNKKIIKKLKERFPFEE